MAAGQEGGSSDPETEKGLCGFEPEQCDLHAKSSHPPGKFDSILHKFQVPLGTPWPKRDAVVQGALTSCDRSPPLPPSLGSHHTEDVSQVLLRKFQMRGPVWQRAVHTKKLKYNLLVSSLPLLPRPQHSSSPCHIVFTALSPENSAWSFVAEEIK